MVPLIVILPGLLALAVLPYQLYPKNSPEGKAGLPTYNAVLPLLRKHYFGPGLLGLGVLSLVAGFMSGMAGNLSAFATVWTYDIYRPLLVKQARDSHYVSMGRLCTFIGVLISIGAACATRQWENIMTYAQLLFVIFVVPLFVPVVLGMLWKRGTAPAAFWSLLAGILTALGLLTFAYLHPTGFDVEKVNPDHVVLFTFSRPTGTIATNVWTAWWTFLSALIVALVVSLATRPKPDAELRAYLSRSSCLRPAAAARCFVVPPRRYSPLYRLRRSFAPRAASLGLGATEHLLRQTLRNLVYGLTPIPSHKGFPLLRRPVFWGGALFVAFVILNIIFW